MVLRYLRDAHRALWRGEYGATMPEYALMVGLIAAVAFAGAELIGVNVLARFTDFAGSFSLKRVVPSAPRA